MIFQVTFTRRIMENLESDLLKIKFSIWNLFEASN